eukprot:CAMPEP_0182467860 /NCGR_PEP_ID=MMETSP1319-20130603/14628_1 /TAXON_ID=172717 /ORGANISM="Bolidomonas pacifica, Strain RCC208" /LENGTH=209 /DNA_ID=CAMNT_0024667993 /DNA_START=332 /DNA_END=958 /DNA_ORIENTATION=+
MHINDPNVNQDDRVEAIQQLLQVLELDSKTQQDATEAYQLLQSHNLLHPKSLTVQQDDIIQPLNKIHGPGKSTPSPATVLTLPVTRSLRRSLKEYQRLETLSGSNGWRPTPDSARVSVRKGLSIRLGSLPPAFAVSLNRFSVDWTTGAVRKSEEPCSVPGSLLGHELLAVVCHTGTPAFGHYIAYVRRGSKWWRCDDDRVHEVAWREVR